MVEPQLVVYNDSQVFDRVNSIQSLSIHSVFKDYWVLQSFRFGHTNAAECQYDENERPQVTAMWDA